MNMLIMFLMDYQMNLSLWLRLLVVGLSLPRLMKSKLFFLLMRLALKSLARNQLLPSSSLKFLNLILAPIPQRVQSNTTLEAQANDAAQASNNAAQSIDSNYNNGSNHFLNNGREGGRNFSCGGRGRGRGYGDGRGGRGGRYSNIQCQICHKIGS